MAAGLSDEAQGRSVNVYFIGPVLVPTGVLLEEERTAIQMFREIGVNLCMLKAIPVHDPSGDCETPIVVQFVFDRQSLPR